MPALLSLSKNRFSQIRALHTKKERLKTGLTLMEGERLIAEAFQAGKRLQQVLGTSDGWARKQDLLHRLSAGGIPTFLVTDKQLQALAATEQPAGLLAVVSRPVWQPELLRNLAGEPRFLGMAGAGLQDPGNLGTLLRTLAAAGGQGAWLDEGCADASSPKMLRASAGTVLRLPVIEHADLAGVLADCKAKQVLTLAAVPKGGRSYTSLDLTQSTMFVLGSEGEGLPDPMIKACQQKVSIPMPGNTDSLNVAVAGAILIYEALRQRRLSQAAKLEDDRERAAGKNSR